MATSTQFLNAVRAAKTRGWTLYRRPGGYGMNAPSCENQHPRPNNIPGSWWPGETYTRLRQISFVLDGQRVSGVWIRESVPWVTAHDHKASLKAAIAFLESE